MYKYLIKCNGRPKMMLTGLILVLSVFLFQGCKQLEPTPVPAESLSIQERLEDESLAYDGPKAMGLMQLANPDFDLILANIFSFLNQKSFYRASLVCQVWREVTRMSGETRSLNLSKEKLEVNDCKMLVEAPFSSLILRSCQLGNKEALVLSACSKLKMLDLSKNAIDSVGAEYLAKGNLTQLTSLNLGCNNIDSIGVKSLVSGNLRSLTFLDIFQNKVADEGLHIIANGNLSLLATLRMSKNNIGTNGVKAIKTGCLSTLTSLYLASNNLGDDAAETLAAGKLPALKFLDLKMNKITDRGAEALANGNFPSLTLLILNQNLLGLEGVRILKTGKLSAQTKVLLRGNKIDLNSASYTVKTLSDCIYECAHSKIASKIFSRYIDCWFKLSCEKLNDFDARDLAGSIHGLVAFKDAINSSELEVFLSKMFKVAENKLSTFTPHNLASFILDLGKLLGTYEKIPLSFLESLFKVVGDELKNFDHKHLVNSLIGLGDLGIPNSLHDSFINKWQSMAEGFLTEFNPNDLSGSLCGFAKFTIQPCKNFLERWEQEALIKLKDFNPKPLSITLYSLARLGIEPAKEFLDEWNNVAISKLHEFDFQSVSSSIYAYALLEYDLKEEFINKIKRQYFDCFSLEGIDIRTARELYLALSYYGIEFPSGCKDIVNKFRQSKYNNPSISSFHDEVIEQLNRIFPAVVLEPEFWIDDICCSVDIAIGYKKLIIEVDGPYHFIRTSEGEYIKSPDDKFKDKLLTKSGWTVKRISYLEWPKGNDARLNFLKKMLADISI